METCDIPSYLSSIFILLIIISIHSRCTHVEAASISDSSDQRRPYIVHVQSNIAMSHQRWHESFLPASSQGLLYSFRHVMSGFAAMLTEEEIQDLRKKDGFLHAHPSQSYELTTTHSPKFLGLEPGDDSFWKSTGRYGRGVIIGVLDTGISPIHPSFDDNGMPSPPEKWNGTCEDPIVCNNKVIGAKSFIFNPDGSCDASSTPVDDSGHGTHTAGTAAGRFVGNASVLGSAYGTASGVAPDAHLAIYRVCQIRGCETVSILAGMETAMEDGVDVISISLGGFERQLYNDPISIASFKAVNKGIFVSASAGNGGPTVSTLGNASPWIFTVGASTIDRKLRAVVKLSNGLKFEGQSAYQPKNETSDFLPMMYSMYCSNVSTLKTIGVEGKMVLCDAGVVGRNQKGLNVKEAGGVAMVYIHPRWYGFLTDATADVIPTSGVTYRDGQTILNNHRISVNVQATIEFLGTQIGGNNSNSAPAVASFSSRGPSTITPGFVKPDVIGPGVNILAAWPKTVGAFAVTPTFNIISGTSMACPHLSGVAALLKSAHPDWSPAMIKSAIITTSDWTDRLNGGNYVIDQYDHRAASFSMMGSGQVNPIKANNPGLVYDNIQQNEDYVSYLCGLGYEDNQVSTFIENSTCSDVKKTIDGIDLNYPSVVVALGDFNNYSRSFSRVVTNVGPSYSYNLTVSPPHGVIVNIEPQTLRFTSINGGQMNFTVNVSFDARSREYSSSLEEYGYFAWISMDEKIMVRSPLIVSKESNIHIGK